MEGKVRPESLRGLTTISVIAWLFLTSGNVLGSWWAYNELGWGGWWFWDPVENSSFVPWLLMTAQLHALVLLRFRAHLTKTVLFFCIVSFALCLLGTFIVRSVGSCVCLRPQPRSFPACHFSFNGRPGFISFHDSGTQI